MASKTTPKSDLRSLVAKTFPQAQLVDKKSYTRVTLPRDEGRNVTLGYLYLEQTVPSVELPVVEDGKVARYERHVVKTAKDAQSVLSSMKRVAKVA